MFWWSSRDQAMDIVMAINMGGDDFVDSNLLIKILPGKNWWFIVLWSLVRIKVFEYMGVIFEPKAMDLVYQG